jgi:hypothetical protein
MLALNTSCLVTDDLVERSPTPPKVNHLPRLVESSAKPSNAKPLEPTKDLGCKVDLRIGVVVDEDVSDELSVRWFVDYDDSPGAPTQPISRALTIPASGTPERSGDAAKFEFRTKDYPLGLHVVQVVVSDGFSNDESPRDPAPGRGTAGYSWFVDTTNAQSCKVAGGGT